MAAWGFDYKTSLVWVKTTHDGFGLAWGTGYYARFSHELLLIGKRGQFSIPAREDRVPSVIMAARRRHSQKPEVVIDMLDAQYPRARKVELFCRRPRFGWAVWGKDVPQGGGEPDADAEEDARFDDRAFAALEQAHFAQREDAEWQ